LRPSVRFHDGTPVTAKAVAAILEQEIARPDARGFEAVDKIDVPDERTLVMRLKTPDAFLIGVLGGTLIIDDRKPDVGTGPFRLVTRRPTTEAVRNDNYYRGRPDIDRIKVLPYDTPRAAWAALMRGDVDMAHEVNRESVEFTAGASRVTLYSSIRPFYIPLVFNVRHPILAHPEVRRALAQAINRDEIVARALHGRAQVAEDPVWPSHWAYNSAARHYQFNPAAASVRLDAAGFPVRPAAPGSGRMASRFALKCVFWGEDTQFELIALLLQRQLAEVGVDLVLERATQKELLARASSGQFDTYLFQMTSGRSFEWIYSFWHSTAPGLPAEFQNSGYSGADPVLDRLRESRSDDEIRSAIGDLRQRFYEDAPAAFLAWTQVTRAVDARFDVGDESSPDVFANLWQWHLAGAKSASR
jgi:peptide/nickel transport system substrate-binding protein